MISDTLLAALPLRAKILAALRSALDGQGFVEVETPVRIPAPANEPHIRPPASGNAFLRASPELQMKQLLAAGMEKIYSLGPCFREGERGDHHAPEFTMLEWYRAHAGYRAVLDDAKQLVQNAARILRNGDESVFRFRGVELDLFGEWIEIPVREAFRRYAGWDPIEAFDPDRFDLDMALVIEPSLPRNRPCVLIDYPAPAASLSRLSPADSRIAERWELYLGGLELANAFGELTDPAEQRARFQRARQEKIALGEPAFDLDEEFLSALPNMPPSGGAAMGVDRLCMVLLELDDIENVRPFLPPIGSLW